MKSCLLFIFSFLILFSANAQSFKVLGLKLSSSNVAPTANAGSDQTITLPTSTGNLVGTASADSDGSIVTYAWTKISGPATYSITDAAASSTSATGLVEGTYVFRLTVTDDDGATGTDDVTITVNPGEAADSLGVAFDMGTPNAPANWNNIRNGALTVTNALWLTSGSASTIDVTLSAHSNSADNGSGYCVTPTHSFPTEVDRYVSNTSSSRTITFAQLDDSKTYDFVLLPSRQTTASAHTTVVTSQSKSASAAHVSNCSADARITGLVPSGGVITITVSAGNGGTINYINAFKLIKN
jgi:hypothetical protein